MTEGGVLTDFEGNKCRINDQPMTLMEPAARFCQSKLKKGMKVSFETNKSGDKTGWINKIYQDTSVDIGGTAVEDTVKRMEKAGFATPGGEIKKDCTSPDTPGVIKHNDGLPKILEAKVFSVNPETRVLTLWTKEFKLPISWTGQRFDIEMAKFKQWDPVKVTYEVGTPNRLTDIIPNEKKGGQTWQPKKPRFTIGFTIPLAQFESVRIDVEGNSPEECKAGLAESIDSLGKNNPAVKDMLQKFKGRLL